MILTIIAAAVLGVLIGVLSGLLGIGGGVVMVPMFRLVFGLSALASTATSLFTIIPTSISGLIAHLRRKTCLPKLGLAMGLGGACTSPIGVWLANQSPAWAVMVAAALVIGYSAFNMAKKVRALPKSGKAGASEKASGKAGTDENASEKAAASNQPAASTTTTPTTAPTPTHALAPAQLARGVAIGAIAGLASGYVGLGGGFLLIPLMLALFDIPMKLASGTSLIAIMLIAIPGAITQGALGNIDYAIGLATAIGTIPGAYLGARLVSRVPERTLRIVFSVFLALGAILLIVKELL